MEAQRTFPLRGSNAYRHFAWLVATASISECFSEALAALDEFGKREVFPLKKYESSASRALILQASGELVSAKPWAREALNAASRDNSGFPHHPRVGVVRNPDPRVFEQLKQLAA